MICTRPAFRIFCLVLTILSACCAFAASDVTGVFTLGAPTAAGKDVQLTISLTLFNHTTTGVSNASVTLHEPKQARVTYGSVTGVSIPAGGQSRLSGSFTVPRSLYDSWQKGSGPAISISFTDGQGNPARMFVKF